MLHHLSLLVGFFLGLSGSLSAEEILLLRGSPVSTPDLRLVSPSGPGQSEGLKFRRDFFIEKGLLESLSEPTSQYGKVPVTAAEAIEIVTKDLNPNHELQSFVVTNLELLQGPEGGSKRVEFYLITAITNGSEIQRVVMMNRMILSSRLKRLRD
jgi:hypothetical protein